MDRLTNIVVGVDFSGFSQVALRQAIRIARVNQAKLYVIHVIRASVVDDLKEALRDTTDGFHEEVRVTAAERLGQFIDDCRPEGLDIAADVVIGSPLVEILRCVQDVSSDMLMLGMKGSTGDRPGGAGGVAAKCLRKAATRVMLVHENSPERFQSVVACVDFSETSGRVIEQAVRMSLQDKACLHVMHAFYPPWEVLHYMAPTRQASPDYQEQYRQQLDDRLHQLLKPFEADTSQLKVDCHLLEVSETPEAVLECKQQTNADLIVIGTRGRTGLKALLLGSTAERIIRESPCSVLAVKPEGFEYKVD